MSKLKIEPEKWYTLTDLVKLGMFSWKTKDIRMYRDVVNADKKSRNFLKAIVVGKGVATRYTIKGENIIKFLAQVEDKGLSA